jgi:hypothetical protein
MPTQISRWPARLATSSSILLCGFAASSAMLFREVERMKATAPSTEARELELRKRLTEEMIRQAKGLFDSSPDPDVGRLVLPGLVDFVSQGEKINTNSYGIREVEYELPKPADVYRVVILGDSFVFAEAVRAEERLGAHLRTHLLARANGLGERKLECLHIGVPGWNLRAETQFLRRQLDLLRPDLVVHLLITNDLEDSMGIRGFGALANYSDQRRGYADGVIAADSFRWQFGKHMPWVKFAADWEGIQRYTRAAQDMRKLSDAIEKLGGRYLAWAFWVGEEGEALRYFGAHLRAEQLAFLDPQLFSDQRYRVSAGDPHWNVAGHRHVAMALYGLLQERGYLDAIGGAAWEDASRVSRELHTAGQAEAERSMRHLGGRIPSVPSALVMEDVRAGKVPFVPIHGGIDKNGLVSPWASILLSAPESTRLEIRGACPAGVEMDGAEVTVSIEGVTAGKIALRGRQPFEASFEIPAEVRGRKHLNVRFEASDWFYVMPNLRVCRAFRLDSAALLP